MMKILTILLITVISLLSASCSVPSKKPIDKLNSHIAKVEREYSNYNQQDWNEANLEFERIVANIELNYDKMTREEKDAAMKAIGRYYGLTAKQGFQDAAHEAQKVLEALPAFIDGFSSAFDE